MNPNWFRLYLVTDSGYYDEEAVFGHEWRRPAEAALGPPLQLGRRNPGRPGVHLRLAGGGEMRPMGNPSSSTTRVDAGWPAAARHP